VLNWYRDRTVTPADARIIRLNPTKLVANTKSGVIRVSRATVRAGGAEVRRSSIAALILSVPWPGM
jgi:hypothetical protein